MTDQGTYRRLAALAHAGRRLGAAASRDDAIELIATAGLEALAGDSAAFGRIEHQRGLLRILRNVGDLASWEVERPDGETYPLVDFPQLTVAPDRATAWSGTLDEPGLPRPIRALLRALGKHALLFVPLVVDGVMWGMLAVLRSHERQPFDAEDLALAEALGGLLGATLGRIEDRNELQALAYRDALTGLGNRRAVDDRLEAIFDRDDLRTPVAVILCDVNGLKAVNDVHGHDAGDRLLRDVAALLSTEAGMLPGALAARLGGDEYCLVVEGVDPDQLDAITRRMRQGADHLELGDGLACGWAIATKRPGDAPTAVAAARALLRLADAAQYRVKRTGRDVPFTAMDRSATSAGNVEAELVETALDRLEQAPSTVVDRLTVIATTIHDVVDAGAWAVSLSRDGGPATIVRNLDRPRHVRSGNPAMEPGDAFDLDDYPATRAALRGGSFHATLITGDDAERGFLAASGYVEMIAAGAPDGGDAWLVEVCADALSRSLITFEPLLRLLVVLAVNVPASRLHPERSVENSV